MAASSNRNRRVSIMSAEELNVLGAEWKLAEEYTNTGRIKIQNNDCLGALELCTKALTLHPDYFPAIQLKKDIRAEQKRLQELEEAEKDATFTLSLSEDETDYTQHRTAFVGSTPVRKPKQNKLMPQQIKVKSCLKPSASAGNCQIPHEPENPSGKAVSWGMKKKSLSERRLQNLLLEGYFQLLTPIDLFERLNELRCLETGIFHCPAPKCKISSTRRLEVIGHFLDHHFDVNEDGKKVLPFFCKTCEKRFRSADDLLSHGAVRHASCRWADELKQRIQYDN